LDVAFVGPPEISLVRNYIEVEKECGRNKFTSTIPKDEFPSLLRELHLKMKEHGKENLRVGFKNCGIILIHS
jgi:hypothetical protein